MVWHKTDSFIEEDDDWIPIPLANMYLLQRQKNCVGAGSRFWFWAADPDPE